MFRIAEGTFRGVGKNQSTIGDERFFIRKEIARVGGPGVNMCRLKSIDNRKTGEGRKTERGDKQVGRTEVNRSDSSRKRLKKRIAMIGIRQKRSSSAEIDPSKGGTEGGD